MTLSNGHFQVSTIVEAPFATVRQHFNRELFEELTQGFPPIHLTRFDGVFMGAQTHLRLFASWGPRWVSTITQFEDSPERLLFVDEGNELPPGLGSWHHTHLVEDTGSGTTRITDSIVLQACPKLLNAIFVLAFQRNMKSRGPVYRKHLESLAAGTGI